MLERQNFLGDVLYIDSAREVVSRMLRDFAAEGIVEQYRGGMKSLTKSGCGKLSRLALMEPKGKQKEPFPASPCAFYFLV